MAFRTLIDDLHAKLADVGYADIRPAYGFVLLAARERALTVNDVAALNGMTKQAASKLVQNMEQDGYLARVTDDADARSRPVQLAPRGRALLREVDRIYRELEGEWATQIGARALDGLRQSLTTVMRNRYDGDLPPIRPTW